MKFDIQEDDLMNLKYIDFIYWQEKKRR